MSTIKQLAGQTVYYGLSSIVARFITFFLTPIYTYSSIIDEAKMGRLTELMSYTALLLVLFSFRFEAAYFRYGKDKENEEDSFNAALNAVMMTSLVPGILLFIFSPLVASYLGYEGFEIYFRMLALILCTDALCEIPLSKLRFDGQPKRFAFIKIASIVINFCLNVFFVVACPWLQKLFPEFMTWFSPDDILTYILLSNLIASGMTLFMLRDKYHAFSRPDYRLIKNMWHYVWPLVIVSEIGLINEMFGRIILKWFLTGSMAENEVQLGIYGVNYRLATLITLFTQAFRYAAEPFFFKESNQVGVEKTYAQVAKYYLIFSVFGFLTVSLYIDVFKYFIGPKYFEGLIVVPILLLANVFNGLYFNISIWYRLKDKTLTGAMIALTGMLITIFLNWLLVPRIGYIGSALATLSCYIAMTVICYYTGRKVLAVPYEIGKMMAILLISSMMIGVFFLLRPHINIYLNLSIATGAMILFSLVLYQMDKSSIQSILRVVQRK